MNDELKQLEQEVEAMLVELGPALDVTPHEAAVMRAKEASAHAMNEVWLVGKDQPTPSPLAVERTKAAVAAALASQGDGAWWQFAARRSLGVAAAVLLLVIGGLWYMQLAAGPTSTPSPGEVVVSDPTEEQVDVFVAVAEGVFADDAMTVSILSEIEEIEASLPSWESGASGDLQTILGEIDALLASEPEPDQVRSGAKIMAQGVWG